MVKMKVLLRRYPAAGTKYVNVTERTSGSGIWQSPHARGVVSAPDVMSSVWRMLQHYAWWHSLCYSFRHVVQQFHLPTINSISVIINLLGQPSSEKPCICPYEMLKIFSHIFILLLNIIYEQYSQLIVVHIPIKY